MNNKNLGALSGLLIAVLCFLCSGCTIAKQVRAAPSGTEIAKIYVAENPSLHMKGLVPEVVAQLKILGFEAETFSGPLPPDAKHHLEVTANWRWDMAMYLFYFEATLFENRRLLGTAEYDARMGGANMGKFGGTAEKIRPLLRDLLANVSRRRPTATPLGTSATTPLAEP